MTVRRKMLWTIKYRKVNRPCIYKAAYFITKIEEYDPQDKKCIYYVNLVKKIAVRKNCVCMIEDEVRSFIEYLEKLKEKG